MGGLYASGQLSTTIESLRARIDDSGETVNSFEVEIQKKFALAWRAPSSSSSARRSRCASRAAASGLVIGVSLGVFALYYVGLIAGEALANRAILSPFWSMWATDILFTAVGLLMLARMGHSTGRGGGGGEWVDAIRTRARRLLAGAGLGGERPTAVRAGP
jgi:lipopolysaccharide export system permease protein